MTVKYVTAHVAAWFTIMDMDNTGINLRKNAKAHGGLLESVYGDHYESVVIFDAEYDLWKKVYEEAYSNLYNKEITNEQLIAWFKSVKQQLRLK